MMQIGGLIFDLYDGHILLPQWHGRTYTLPGTEHAGIHLQPPVPRPFTLRLTRFDAAANIQLLQQQQVARIGIKQAILAAGVQYDLFPWRVLFVALDIQPVSAEIIPYAAGSRYGISYAYGPAVRLTTDWTLVAVPITE